MVLIADVMIKNVSSGIDVIDVDVRALMQQVHMTLEKKDDPSMLLFLQSFPVQSPSTGSLSLSSVIEKRSYESL